MKENERKVLAAKIRSMREAEGISQEKLAELCEVSWRTVSNLECGKSTPDLRFVLALAAHFNIGLDKMLAVSDGGQDKSYARLCKENKLAALSARLNENMLDLAIQIVESLQDSPLNTKH